MYNKIVCVLLLTLLTSGCASIRGGPDIPRTPSVTAMNPMDLMDTATLSRYNDAPATLKMGVRNEIIDERILEMDYQFRLYEEDLWKEGIGMGIGTDWLLLAMTGATATVGGETLKSALGAASTGIQGAKTSFDKNVYYEKTLPALLAQMVAEREKIRARIIQSKLLPVPEYTLYAALSDLNRYYEAGTLRGVIQIIATDAGEKESRAEAEIRRVIQARYAVTDRDVRDRINSWLNANLENVNALERWLREQNPPVTELGGIWVDDDETSREELEAAIEALQIP